MRSRSLLLLLVLMVTGVPLSSQEDAGFAGFHFNRSLPGARSLGMGGAFVALADDATAAYSNPAGLTLLESPEVALEARQWSTSTLYTARGDATPQSSFRLEDFEFDETETYVVGPSFLSFVYAKPDARWALAVYRHELINFESKFSSFGVRKDNDEFFGPLEFSTDVEIVNLGLSGSFRISNNLRIGLGVSYYDFQLLARQTIRKPTNTIIAGKEGSDSDIDFNAGFLWEINPAWTVGGAYRRGPAFEMRECFPARGILCFRGDTREPESGGFNVESEFHVPSQIAFGLGYQPNDSWTFLIEYDRIEYSALLEGNRLGHFTVNNQSYQFDLEDADEFRVGVEYLLQRPRGESISFMLGSWFDPNHSITFSSESTLESIRTRRAFFQPTGDDEIHFSAGLEAKIGFYQVNFGIDHSELIDTLSLSSVVRFR